MFGLILPWWWRWAALAAALLAAAAFGAAKMHAHDQVRYDELEAKFETFKDRVTAAGVLAKQQAIAKEAADKKRKDAADAENSAALATLADTIAGLRRDRPGGGVLSPGPASPGGADVACFDRPAVERAYGALVVGLRGLGDEGAQATVNLDTAKRWAQPAPP